ncbi:hypothetical protein HP550_17430 [Cellulomonas humilata]|uniref:Uncharacterized protein n=1 Tax=Cellulomonas humilata TaxID=144055 RepID=A0A7Y6A3G4_9CELL|nr:hypothetical protein [Cellulomonas humilata]NUU19033.1 hypothetical protein [Cellulomonas humilata]
MSSELGTLLARAVDELSTDGPMDELRAAGLRRIVRRRRVERHSVESVAAVAAAGVVGTAAWFGLDRLSPPPPAHDPTPSVTATPTPTPSATPAPEPTTAPTLAPAVAGVPSAFVAPPDLLEQTGPGWMLASYRPRYVPTDRDDVEQADDQVLHLVSPDGAHYAVVTLPVDPTVDILYWDAGAPRARVRQWTEDERLLMTLTPATSTGWLDLRTGTVTLDGPDFNPTGEFLAVLPDGTELWSENKDYDENIDEDPNPGEEIYAVAPGAQPRLLASDADWRYHLSLDPGAERFAILDAEGVAITSVADGTQQHISLGRPAAECDLVSWLDRTGVLAACRTTTGGTRLLDNAPALYRVDTGDSTVTLVHSFVAGEPIPAFPGAGSYVRDGVVVFASVPVTADTTLDVGAASIGLTMWTADGLSSLPGVPADMSTARTRVRGDVIYVDTRGWAGLPPSADGPVAGSVVAIDTLSGSTTELSSPGRPQDGVARWLGDDLTWWVAGASGG